MTVFSRPANSSSKEIMGAIKQQERMWPPPIPFAKARKKKSKTSKKLSGNDSDDDEDKTKYLKVDINFDPSNPKRVKHTKKKSISMKETEHQKSGFVTENKWRNFLKKPDVLLLVTMM